MKIPCIAFAVLCKNGLPRMLKAILYYTVVLVVVLFFCTLLPSMIYITLAPLAKSSYDYQIADCTEQDAYNMETSPYIDEVFPVRSLSTIVSADGKQAPIIVDFADDEYLDQIHISPYSDQFLIQGRIPRPNASTGEIILDRETCISLHASVGDSVELGFSANGDSARFKIVGILEPSNVPKGFGFAPYSEYASDIWERHHDGNDLPITASWATVLDESAAEQFFWQDYHRDMLEEANYSDLEISQLNHQFNTKREDMLEEATLSLGNLPYMAYIGLVAGSLILLVFILRESGKEFAINRTSLNTLASLGAKRWQLSIALTCKAVIPYAIASFISGIIVSTIIYPYLMTGVYLPGHILGYAIAASIALYIPAVLFDAWRRLRHETPSNV